jgi:hypothetical protein
MKTISTLWAKFCVWFDSLPVPVKAIFWVALNGTFAMLSADLKELEVNKYLNIWIGAIANLSLWASLYFGSKTDKAETIKAKK